MITHNSIIEHAVVSIAQDPHLMDLFVNLPEKFLDYFSIESYAENLSKSMKEKFLSSNKEVKNISFTIENFDLQLGDFIFAFYKSIRHNEPSWVVRLNNDVKANIRIHNPDYINIKPTCLYNFSLAGDDTGFYLSGCLKEKNDIEKIKKALKSNLQNFI